jgi:predicted O-methyltransferase YrrM
MKSSKPLSRQIGKPAFPPSTFPRFRASFSTFWCASPARGAFWKSELWADTAPSAWPARFPKAADVTLEVNPRHADVARANLLNAGVLDRVDIHVGRAIDTLPILASSGAGPFDLIFIDADKPSNSDYLAWALKLSRPGTLIVTDNVVRDGRVVQAESADADVQCVRRFTEMMAAEPRLSATVLQTVGVKGYDGFALAVVLR